jgi:pyroglutamyl-peptidase
MKILLTGFNPFGKLVINPSELIVQIIENRAKSNGLSDVITSVLKTEYTAAEHGIHALLSDIRPQACICLGVAEGSQSIRLERIALNIDDTDAPDNAGELRCDQRIVPNGPDVYQSTLPLSHIRDALQSRGIPVTLSNHAGTYICNHVFYTSLHLIRQLGMKTKCGFIHVPLISEEIGMPSSDASGLPLETMVEAIECCLNIVREDG